MDALNEISSPHPTRDAIRMKTHSLNGREDLQILDMLLGCFLLSGWISEELLQARDRNTNTPTHTSAHRPHVRSVLQQRHHGRLMRGHSYSRLPHYKDVAVLGL